MAASPNKNQPWSFLKRVAARLPERWQSELKRIRYRRQIRKGTFETSEPEYKILPQIIKPGDWVVDVGANIGHYTKRFSELVGAAGRVIAFEPVPTTFALLAANTLLFAHANVTLINAAVSDKIDVVGMSIPRFSTGLPNCGEAQLSSGVADSEYAVLTLTLDSLRIDKRIALVKIDVEGHQAFVINGMRRLLLEHHPVLIVETGLEEVRVNLSALGYIPEKMPGSPNLIFRAQS